jgi:hypothetical protein
VDQWPLASFYYSSVPHFSADLGSAKLIMWLALFVIIFGNGFSNRIFPQWWEVFIQSRKI